MSSNLNQTVSALVRRFGGTTAQAQEAVTALAERELGIANDIVARAARLGYESQAREIVVAAGLTCTPPVDPAIADATARIQRAEAELAQARAQLSRVAR